MQAPALTFSDDQAEAYDRAGRGACWAMGSTWPKATLTPMAEGKASVLAVVGKAGSGKTMLLAELYRGAEGGGGRRGLGRLRGAPAQGPAHAGDPGADQQGGQSVLRLRGVPATTIHRILYTPVYDPQYEKIAEWLAGHGPAPGGGGADRTGAGPGACVLSDRSPRSPARWRRRG